MEELIFPFPESNNNNNDDDRPLFTDMGDYRIAYIDIIEDIGSPQEYSREFTILRTAKETDKVLITINTNGGQLDTTVHLIDAIDTCAGTVTARLVGNGFSGGSLIFLATPNKEVGRAGTLMMHRESSSYSGKGTDINRQVEFHNKFMTELYTSVYGPYLSGSDFTKLMDGNDLWFTPSETKSLINKPQE